MLRDSTEHETEKVKFFAGADFEGIEDDDSQLYVATNDSQLNGATNPNRFASFAASNEGGGGFFQASTQDDDDFVDGGPRRNSGKMQQISTGCKH